MTDLTAGPKPTHREWRKAVKKARRQRIRQRLAEARKAREKLLENSPSYKIQMEKERLLEEYEAEKEAKEREERLAKWLEEEERAQKEWRENQRLKKLAEEERIKEQEKIRLEWEKEQAKIREEKERLEKIKKDEEKRRQETIERINDFIHNDGDIPPELLTISETKPGKELCSFFSKVGACRFGIHCSRNHQHLKISNVLMILNFYTHFTLDQTKSSEYDTDIGLEYEESDMYQHFREFYLDIVPEFKRFGEVMMIKICCNSEPHLRGNVYVEYKSERDALVAYNGFQGRWYGGKQLNIEFVKITDWGSAVCGDFARKRCPKGKSCNFLHVFRNPRNEYAIDWSKNRTNTSQSTRDDFNDNFDDTNTRKRNWRWSESPEKTSSKRRYRSPTQSDRRESRSSRSRRSRSPRRKSTEHRDHRSERKKVKSKK